MSARAYPPPPEARLRDLGALGWSCTRVAATLEAEGHRCGTDRAREALRHLGLLRPPGRPWGVQGLRITSDMAATARAMRGHGATLKEIGARLGMAASSVHAHRAALGIAPGWCPADVRRARAAGATTRPPGPLPPVRSVRFSAPCITDPPVSHIAGQDANG